MNDITNQTYTFGEAKAFSAETLAAEPEVRTKILGASDESSIELVRLENRVIFTWLKFKREQNQTVEECQIIERLQELLNSSIQTWYPGVEDCEEERIHEILKEYQRFNGISEI